MLAVESSPVTTPRRADTWNLSLFDTVRLDGLN
jgi:hypothetical protein